MAHLMPTTIRVAVFARETTSPMIVPAPTKNRLVVIMPRTRFESTGIFTVCKTGGLCASMLRGAVLPKIASALDGKT